MDFVVTATILERGHSNMSRARKRYRGKDRALIRRAIKAIDALFSMDQRNAARAAARGVAPDPIFSTTDLATNGRALAAQFSLALTQLA